MKAAIGMLALVALLASPQARANCRAADAAKAGGDAGLARDQAAATETANNESANSDTLGKCINGITSIVVAPTFPSLTSIFEAATTKMCKLASDNIPRVPPIDPATVIPLLSNGVPPTPLATPGDHPSTPETPVSSSSFWSKIWR